MNSKICELLDIEFPLVAFTHCRDVVVAVSKAGGIGVLGAVGYSPDQLKEELDWIDAHIQCFAAIGGAPQLLVPDNTKTAVIKACLYDPQVNRTYGEMAAHYDVAILPARPRRPRDKAKVEQAVLIVERWLLGRLRRHHVGRVARDRLRLQRYDLNYRHRRLLRRLR